MERKVLLGAPSLTGKGIHDAVADAFSGDPFPSVKRITNLTIAPLIFADVRCFADPFFGEKPFCDVTFKDADQMSRFLSDVAQVAESMQYSHMLTIEDISEVIAEVAAETAPDVEIPDSGVSAESKVEEQASLGSSTDSSSELPVASAEDVEKAAASSEIGKQSDPVPKIVPVETPPAAAAAVTKVAKSAKKKNGAK